MNTIYFYHVQNIFHGFVPQVTACTTNAREHPFFEIAKRPEYTIQMSALLLTTSMCVINEFDNFKDGMFHVSRVGTDSCWTFNE